jgi:hypothetical protein
MRFKLIMALVDETCTEDILKAAREAGATGCSVITSARGEGIKPEKTFLGLDLAGARDLILFLVAEPLSRDILETIARAGRFDDAPGAGIAFQVAIEDAVGLSSQMATLTQEIEEQI